ncbi:MAG: prolyl oligopeptidase family serine peptidase [Verrucomicrobiota bacterium]
MRPPSLIVLAALAILGLPATARAAEPTVANQQAKELRRRMTITAEANYLLFLPKDYTARGDRRWPLILFLHGAGERGTNLDLVTVHGPPKMVRTNPTFPFIVVSPQCPDGQIWSDDVLLALLAEVARKYKVDQSRIYLTGLSMGGFGTWSLGLKHPDRFAAIAPICGGGSTLPILLPNPTIANRLKELPIWIFHGAKDPVVALDESERLVKALTKIGNQPKLTVYPEAGHDSWTETYSNTALYDWFLQQRNPGVAPSGKPLKSSQRP